MASDDLLGFLQDRLGEDALKVEETLQDGYVRLRTSEAERRQAKQDIRCVEDALVEMLRNSRDAGARNIFVAMDGSPGRRAITIIDDGIGIPAALWNAVFQPRVTSKLHSFKEDRWGVHGRGMALYSIKQNVEDAMIIASGKGLGCCLAVKVDLSKLPERKDQSTWPTLVDPTSSEWKFSGPRNLLRNAVEFCFDGEGAPNVYIGSIVDVVASLHAHGLSNMPVGRLLSGEEEEKLPVTMRLSMASNPLQLVECASRLGLEISERSAQRIFANEISPLVEIKSRYIAPVRLESDFTPKLEDLRKLKPTADDRDNFIACVEQAFSEFAERYYIQQSGKSTMRVTKDAIIISIPYSKEP